jgi:isopropylmalate/homocitrate/citramalate synthase
MNPNGKKRVWITESTLCNSELARRLPLNSPHRLTIAESLGHSGIDELEAGFPGRSDGDTRRRIREITDLGLPCRVSCLCGANREQLEIAYLTQTQGVHIQFPVSVNGMAAAGKTEKTLLSDLRERVPAARRYFDHVSVGMVDVAGADLLFLEQFAFNASSAGAHRIRIEDVSGALDVSGVIRLIMRLLGPACGTPLEYASERGGREAVNSALTALSAGAVSIRASVFEPDKDGGDVSLAHLSDALKTGGDFFCRIRGVKLRKTADQLAEILDRVRKAA